MKTSYFEKLGIESSLLGFGCMRFPTLADGSIDEKQAEEMMDHAIHNGVTYIDTAYPYHAGESERFVGKVLKKYNRNQFTIATKLPVWKVNKREDVRELFNEQLNKLQMDYIDFYLLHALDNERWESLLKLGVLDEVLDLQKEGKIKLEQLITSANQVSFFKKEKLTQETEQEEEVRKLLQNLLKDNEFKQLQLQKKLTVMEEKYQTALNTLHQPHFN